MDLQPILSAKVSSGKVAPRMDYVVGPDAATLVRGKVSLTGVFWKLQKLRKNYELRDFWDPAEICRKLPENYKTAQKLRTEYDFRQFPDMFRNCLVIFVDFRKIWIPYFSVISRYLQRKP